MSRWLDDRSKKFIDAVQSDLRALSNETRRKFQPVKEVRNMFDALFTYPLYPFYNFWSVDQPFLTLSRVSYLVTRLKMFCINDIIRRFVLLSFTKVIFVRF